MSTVRPAGFAVALLLLFALQLTGLAHEGLREQIVQLNASIKSDPRNGALYLRRAELYRLHREFGRALADYRSAEQMNPSLEQVNLARGMLYLDAAQPRRARYYLDRFLLTHPDHSTALVARARALTKMGEPSRAVDDYSRAIGVDPKPDLYLERARALGKSGAGIDEVLRGLGEGIERLGPIVTLELAAIDLEVAASRFDRALKRLDIIAAQSDRKEHWLVRRGEILRKAGRYGEACETMRGALSVIESQPQRRRASFDVALETRVRASVARCRH
ncbi:MAG TPA: tetratricopeptide repeat protein [Blastocatellia bacterium]|nr:tetratricopeptide repeat protein [Blastocatellia bacterium]